MAMVCPQCRTTYENNLTCPKCNVRLAYFSQRGGDPEALTGDEKWHQTPAGRAFAGVIFALGLSYGLLQGTTSLLHFFGYGVDRVQLSPTLRLMLFYVLQVPAVLAGAMLAGAGRRKAVAFGALVGIVTGGIVLVGLRTGALRPIVQPYANAWLFPPENVRPGQFLGMDISLWTVLAVLPLHLIAGAVGGLITRFIFTPPPDVGMPVLLPSEPGQMLGTSKKVRLPPMRNLQGKGSSIAWAQALVGVVCAIAAVYHRNLLVRFIQDASEQLIKIESPDQVLLINGTIVGLAIFLGGAIAGAGRANGFTQGIMVGIAGGMGQIAFLQNQFAGQTQIFYAVLGAIFLAPLGGYFGCTLLPPAPPDSGVSRD